MPTNSGGSKSQRAKYVVDQAHAQPPPRKKRAKNKSKKSPKKKSPTRLKALWGIFNEKFERVDLFEYSQRKEADEARRKLDDSEKMSHFVRVVKVPLE